MANLRCVICQVVLKSRKAKQQHYSWTSPCRPKPPRQFRCRDCDNEFVESGIFMKHIRKGCANKRYAGLPPSYVGERLNSASAAQCNKDDEVPVDGEHPARCTTADGVADEMGEVSTEVQFDYHDEGYEGGLVPIRGDVGYLGPMEHERAEMLDRLDGLRLAGQVYRLRLATQASGSNQDKMSSGGEQSE